MIQHKALIQLCEDISKTIAEAIEGIISQFGLSYSSAEAKAKKY